LVLAALRLIALVVARLPFRWLGVLGAALGWLVGSVLRIRRAHVERSLGRAKCANPRGAAREMYRALGASVMEIFWFSRRPPGELRSVCSLDETSKLRLAEARARGKGLVLAASHTGNWELAACAMAKELDLSVVVKPIATRGVEAFMTDARRSHGLGLLQPGGALASAREILARGGSVAMLIDQVPEREGHGDPVEFLAANALVDRAPAALSAATGAPLVVVAFRRDAAKRHAVEVLRVLDPPPRRRGEWTRWATREATSTLEAFIRRFPSQWLWMHRRWSAPRASRAAPGSELVAWSAESLRVQPEAPASSGFPASARADVHG
jgi:Kdo2-lipid IVA lauroyltransferase/acyltransferase